MPTSAAAPSQLPVLTVGELNRRVRELLERSVPLLWVSGEICNFTRASSGHWYFSLKDASSQVRCVMFRQKGQYIDWHPRDGMHVEVRAVVTLYEPRGDYQLTIDTMRQAGLGVLYEKFVRLKAALAHEGLFAEARKRPLPPFPRRIGIVTSIAAAALHDVLTTLKRRMPGIAVIVYPTPVQGEGAAARIVAAIRRAAERNECDVLILCRGGGSIEDLWQFNEEILARAIYACPIPVVVGVGHETDFTIADFVADRRAPTPTGAAELASPNRLDLLHRLERLSGRLNREFNGMLERRMQKLDHLGRRLVHPGERIARRREKLAALRERIRTALSARHEPLAWRLQSLQAQLCAARPDIGLLHERQLAYRDRLKRAARHYFATRTNKLAALEAQLAQLSPRGVLARGYSIVSMADGSVVRDSGQLHSGDPVTLQFAHGNATGRITGKQP
jgi:exodeoxyribonuclease VII large subunit